MRREKAGAAVSRADGAGARPPTRCWGGNDKQAGRVHDPQTPVLNSRGRAEGDDGSEAAEPGPSDPKGSESDVKHAGESHSENVQLSDHQIDSISDSFYLKQNFLMRLFPIIVWFGF